MYAWHCDAAGDYSMYSAGVEDENCLCVYRKRPERYAGSETNLNQISLRSDNVFGDDGGAHQLATVKGSVHDDYRAKLVVPVDL